MFAQSQNPSNLVRFSQYRIEIRNNKLDQLHGMSAAAILKRRTALDHSATAALC